MAKKSKTLREVRDAPASAQIVDGVMVLDGYQLSCGCADAITWFSAKGRYYALSVNYPRRYACLEVFEKNVPEAQELVLAEPKDIDKIFGDAFVATSPKKIAERLTR